MTAYEVVTQRIMDKLQQGIIPWRRPWNMSNAVAVNWGSRREYRGINRLLLEPGEYLTFKQVTDAGGRVKKGEHSQIAVFFKSVLQVAEAADGGEDEVNAYKFLRYYHVFEVEQCEGIERKSKIEVERYDHDGIPAAEKLAQDYFSRPGAPELVIGTSISERAYFRPATDTVHVPGVELFPRKEEYYSVLFHETTHSTGAKNRLDRIRACSKRSNAYAYEELVAEIGAATLCGICGIENTIDNTTAYIQYWLNELANDSRLVVAAAGAAQKAVDYITGAQPQQEA